MPNNPAGLVIKSKRIPTIIYGMAPSVILLAICAVCEKMVTMVPMVKNKLRTKTIQNNIFFICPSFRSIISTSIFQKSEPSSYFKEETNRLHLETLAHHHQNHH